MKILFVLEHFYPYIGGAERLFFELTRALAQAGHEVAVITTRFRPDLPAEERVAGVRVRRVDCRNRYWFSIVSLPVVYRMAGQYDVVHTTSYNAALPAWLGGALRQKPVLITFHEVWGQLWWRLPFAAFPQRVLFYLWEQLLLRLPFRRFIAVSEFTRQAFRHHGIPAPRCLRIYNGLDYRELAPYTHRPPETFTVAYFGRLGMSKGLELLLPAVQQLRQAHPDARLKLIVPTYPKPMYEWLLRQLEERGLQEHTQLLHDLPRATLYEAVSTASCVAIPSYSEGFCFVAAEASAIGVPIVSSHKGALPEVVSGRYLSMTAMTADSLAQALRAAYRGQWEERPLRAFELQDAVEAYLELYQEWQ